MEGTAKKWGVSLKRARTRNPTVVMPGLGPGIHVLRSFSAENAEEQLANASSRSGKLVDGRPSPTMTVGKAERTFMLATMLLDQVGEALEEVVAVLRAGRGFGVVLDREDGSALDGDAFIGAVEEGDMGHLDAGG